MSAIEKASEIIKQFEGLKLKAYPDPISGWNMPTIGYGTMAYTTGKNVAKGDNITEEYAEECLKYWVEKKCHPTLKKIPTWNLMNENQQAAIYSFAYNVGEYFFKNKGFLSMTILCNNPDIWKDALHVEFVFMKYVNPGTPAEVGLTRRRKLEAKLFCTPMEGNDG